MSDKIFLCGLSRKFIEIFDHVHFFPPFEKINKLKKKCEKGTILFIISDAANIIYSLSRQSTVGHRAHFTHFQL